MKIIDYGYLIPSLILMLGLPLLLLIKFYDHQTNPLDITIYGSTIQTAILAYYIDKRVQTLYGQQGTKHVNITIISPFDQQTQKSVRQIQKSLISFCGVQGHLLNLLKQLDMQFKINQYGIYFAKLEQLNKQNSLTPESQLQIYKLQSQYPLRSLLEYGLSHVTAKNMFQQFQEYLGQRSKHKGQKILGEKQLQQLSMSSSIKGLFPFEFQQSGIKYLSETIGLDQQYIHDYIMPVIWGSYLHQPNSITTMLKLLPLYCTRNKALGTSLAILMNMNELEEKVVQEIKHVNLKHISNHRLQSFKLLHHNDHSTSVLEPSQSSSQHLTPHYQIQATYLNTFANQSKDDDDNNNQQKQDTFNYHTIKTNQLFIIQDYEMVNKKQISYYKTIIDGKIKNDQQYPQFYTLYFTYDKKQTVQGEQTVKNSKYIYSATRLCKDNCKNFNKNIYLLISKQKLTEKDLGMFEEHHIIYYKKYWLPKTQLPSTKKFEEIQNVYRVYDTQAISDSFQFKLHVLDELSQVVMRKIQQQH